MSGLSIAKSLEFNLLRPTVTHDDVRRGCELALSYHLAAVCVYPVHVSLASEVLRGTTTNVCAAIGFPFGQDSIPGKLVAIDEAQSDGADEMAVMLDHSAIASGEIARASHELERLSSSMYFGSLITTKGRSQLTVVLETALIDMTTLGPLWTQLADSPVGFVQTSSGHQARAVTVEHVQTLRQLLPENVLVKAVGGVQQHRDALALLSAGAVRVGTGSAIVIAQEERHAG